MKITCQACQAKYTIADEKVLGKVVKIRCKKCSATIVVNGNDSAASAAIAAPAVSEAPPAPADNQPEPWTVNVADGDQRAMTEADIVVAYQQGVIGNETFCWRDGMNDWLQLQDIEQLLMACMATRVNAPAQSPVDEATHAFSRGASFGAAAVRKSTPMPAAGNGSGTHGSPAPAARRAGGRAPGADLFRGVAQAGGDEDVLTSAPAGMPQVQEDPGKLTGARNENSVLFSLNALTSKGGNGERQPAMPGAEQSGLIDIRQLSAQMGRQDDKKKSRVDDIMNLAGGGAFSPSLASPVLAPPPIELYAPSAGGGLGRNKGLIFVALGTGALVVVAAIGVAVVLMRGKDADHPENDNPVASASSAAVAPPPTSQATTAETAVPSAASAPASDTPSAAAAQPPESAPTPAATAPVKEAPPKEFKTAAAPTGPRTVPATPATGAAPPATAAVGSGADQPFNMGEAKARLGAIASSVQTCKKGEPSGTGRVIVTFAPSGAAQSAVVSGPPFEGTATGACVSGRFRAARVPAFGGSPFSVSKSFSIN